MSRVLLVGFDPDAVDFSDPALPPGLNPQKIRDGVDIAMKQMRERGWEADHLFIRPDEAADVIDAAIRRRVTSEAWDCVVIGGGIRMPPKSLHTFEAVVNAVHRNAPSAAIAFNTQPEDTGDAAARWLKSAS